MKILVQTGLSMDNKIKIGVIIPTHNRARFLQQTIESVINQTYGNWELYIIDDHSVDSSLIIAKKYTQIDSRLHSLSMENGRGAQAARNVGIKAASVDTTYIAFLDSDDWWHPLFLEKCLQRLKMTGAPIAYTEGKIVFEDSGRETARTGVSKLEDNAYKALLTKPPGPIFSNICIHRNCLVEIGYLDENIVAFQEWDTCLRLAEKFRFAFIDEPLFVWRRHTGETISGNAEQNADGYSQVVIKHKEQIQRIVGRQALAAHYSKLAQLNHINGRKKYELFYWVNALKMGSENVISLIKIATHVLGHILRLSNKQLNDEIQVYG